MADKVLVEAIDTTLSPQALLVRQALLERGLETPLIPTALTAQQ